MAANLKVDEGFDTMMPYGLLGALLLLALVLLIGEEPLARARAARGMVKR